MKLCFVYICIDAYPLSLSLSLVLIRDSHHVIEYSTPKLLAQPNNHYENRQYKHTLDDHTDSTDLKAVEVEKMPQKLPVYTLKSSFEVILILILP